MDETLPLETVGDKARRYKAGIPAMVGDELAELIADEQRALRRAGVPAGVVREGDVLPDGPLTSMTGDATSLAAQTAAPATVLVFYRGDWCPFCDITLRTYETDLLPALAARGVPMLAISPQTDEHLRLAAADKEVTFPLFSDAGNGLARSVGITMEPGGTAREIHRRLGIDIPGGNVDGTRVIPFPTVLVLDAERRVRFVDVHTDYTSRTEPADVLVAVDAVLLED